MNINSDMLDTLNRLGFGADIDAFEDYIDQLREAHSMGKSLVTDAEYDYYRKILEEVKPDSKILVENWETEDEPLGSYDILLEEYGMCSIQTIDSISDSGMSTLENVIEENGDSVNLFASMKQNGHAARAVYANGHLVAGSTRGRYKKGRDILNHLKHVLPEYIPEFEGMPLVEIRGEMIVTKEDFDNILKPMGLKTPLSSVTSLIRESATDEEKELLHFVGYKVIPSDKRLRPKTLETEFYILNKVGIEVPDSIRIDDVSSEELVDTVNAIVEYFEERRDENGAKYDCDGIVVAVNDTKEFYDAGKDGNHWRANIAVKEGKYWKNNVYESEIEEVVFTYGKKYLTPKAVIKPVTCANGAVVTNVPLYNVGVMDRYGLYTGSTIYFRFGGEKGVTLCDEHGDSVRAEWM